MKALAGNSKKSAAVSGTDKALRRQLQEALGGKGAHLAWKKALAGFKPTLRGIHCSGAPYSAWELLEHARIAQWDILEFCRDPKHISPDWPSGYWPKNPAPRNNEAWNKSVKAFESDTKAMEKLVGDLETDLFKPIAHGTGQNILREALLVIDHNSYHLGQFILLRRLLGCWQEP
jgi:hypothetical protein